MSARYSKTASRGRAMTTSTLMGSTGRSLSARALLRPRPRPDASAGPPRAEVQAAATARRFGRLSAGGGSGRVRDDAADRVAALEVAHELDGVGLRAALRRAEPTDRRCATEAVHALADQRRAPTVSAGMTA